MIDTGQLKPFFLHEDSDVRHRVAEYFTDSWAQDDDLIPLVLDALDRYGPAEASSVLVRAHRLPLTERSLPRLLACIADAQDRDVVGRLNRILAHATVPLGSSCRDGICNTPNVLPVTIEWLDRRRKLVGLPGDELWQMLRDSADDDDDDAKYAGELGLSYADDLIEALGRLNVPSEHEVCNLLSSPDLVGEWMELFAVQLAGVRRMQSAIPHLLVKLQVDDDYMTVDAPNALVRIGSPEVVRQVHAAFPSGSELFRMSAADVLGRVKLEDSETAILDLLQSEKDATIRTELCFGLCKLFSQAGVDVVCKEIAVGYDRMLVGLEEELLAAAEVMGVDLPEAAEWRAMCDDDKLRLAALQAELERSAVRRREAEAWGLDALEDAAEDTDDNDGEPIRSRHLKVGRNDPCPCGSGKKYKKCCGSPKGGPAE